jgi:transcriptional regulator with XRE-family HTH domain
METLLKLRKSSGATQKEIADFLGISRQAYANYESGNREPDNNTLIKLASYFNISVDYLLGNETPVSSLVPEETQLSEREKLLLSIFRNLPEDVQTAYIDQGRVYEGILKKD